MEITQIEKDIIAGKYRDYYLIYNRKSTDDSDNQKNSIKYQLAENTRFAFVKKIPIAPISLDNFIKDGVISEKHSAFKEDFDMVFGANNSVQYRVERPKFYKLAEWLNKRYFKGVIFLCYDRACRNKGDETILRKLMRAGIDVQFALATYDKTSSCELQMDIEGTFSIHHSRVTREKVMLTIHKSRAAGLCINKAPVGYLNEGNMLHKPKDPQRAPIIAKLFEMYATGEWSLMDLSRWAIEQGFTMVPARRHRTKEEMLADDGDDDPAKIEQIARIPTYNSIHKILINPFYMGMIRGNDGQYIKSTSHEGLAKPELFARVQAQLKKSNKSAHYIKVIDYPFRGIVRCTDCSRLYTPYVKKGIIYFGSRCAPGCTNPNKNFNLNFLTKETTEIMGKLLLTEDELAGLDKLANTDAVELDKKRTNHLEEAERKKKKILEDLAYMDANRLSLLKSRAYSPEKLASEEATLNLSLNALNNVQQASGASMIETIQEVIKLSELLKEALPTYHLASPQEKEELAKIVFSELNLSGKTLDFKAKNGFQSLESRFETRFVAPCARGGTRTHMSRNSRHFMCRAYAFPPPGQKLQLEA